MLGWYSAGLGHKTPAVTLVGTGKCRADRPVTTRLEFCDGQFSKRLLSEDR
jgi:hypothetical protein